jgi:hypothetical protein
MTFCRTRHKARPESRGCPSPRAGGRLLRDARALAGAESCLDAAIPFGAWPNLLASRHSVTMDGDLALDAAGSEVGHVIYDAYGTIVENALLLILTDRLFSAQPPSEGCGQASAGMLQ